MLSAGVPKSSVSERQQASLHPEIDLSIYAVPSVDHIPKKTRNSMFTWENQQNPTSSSSFFSRRRLSAKFFITSWRKPWIRHPVCRTLTSCCSIFFREPMAFSSSFSLEDSQSRPKVGKIGGHKWSLSD